MKENIKKYIISNFIKEHRRSPSRNELIFLYNDYVNSNQDSLEIGLLCGERDKLQQASEESSKDIYNNINKKIILDLEEMKKDSENTQELYDETFRNYNAYLNKQKSDLKKIEREINKDLLLYSNEDIFNYSIIETFDSYEKVDLENSNCSFLNGKVSGEFKKISGRSFDSSEISYQIKYRGNQGVGEKVYNSISNSLKEDGRFFKVVAMTSSKIESVDFIIDISFKEEREIGTIKYITQAIESNSKIRQSCYWTNNKERFYEVADSNLRLEDNSNYIDINKKNVKAIRIILSKSVADTKIDIDRYGYVFSLDFIGLIEQEFDVKKDYNLYLGEYKIVDEENIPVNYSMATIKTGTCCAIPENTSIDFYLSKDKLIWQKASFNSEGQEIIQFDNSEESLSYGKFLPVDENSESNFIAEEVPAELELKYNERCLNFFLPKGNKELVLLNSLKIKRNVYKNEKINIYDASSGWFFEKGYYHTNITVDNMEGTYLDFGNKACYLNGKQVIGKVFLSYGNHTFKTSKENWKEISREEEIVSLRQLKEVDKLYPYNHKYVIEGMNYNKYFKGKKKYVEKVKIYGYMLEEVTNGYFNNKTDLNIYTVKEIDGNKYFIIKCNENTGDEKIEEYDIKYRNNSSSSGNSLFIKATLKTNDKKVAPKIDQIQVRVI